MDTDANTNERGTGQGASPGEQGGQQPQVHFGCVKRIQSGVKDVNGLCGDAKKDLFGAVKQIAVGTAAQQSNVKEFEYHDLKDSQLNDDSVNFTQYEGVKHDNSGDFNEVLPTDFKKYCNNIEIIVLGDSKKISNGDGDAKKITSRKDKEVCDHWIYNKKQEIKRNKVRVDNFIIKCKNRFTALEKLSGSEEEKNQRKCENEMATTHKIHISIKEKE